MKIPEILDELEQKQLIDAELKIQLGSYERQKPVSLFVYLRTVLYIAVTTFVTGAGVLIYQNIDTLGHTILIILLALLTSVCFVYVFLNRKPFDIHRVKHEGPYFDTVLLLGCLLFLALESYAQYQFRFFGTRYGLAVFVPALLFVVLAYRFDHQGVLSMGLTALASWVGLTATPNELLIKNDFGDSKVILTAIVYGIVVVGTGSYLNSISVKKHFLYTYLLVGGTLYLAACLGGMFAMEAWQLVFGLLLGVGCWYFYKNARQEESLLFLLLSVLFGYIGFTYLIFNNLPLDIGAFLGTFYFLLSAALVVWFFLNFKKLLH